MAFPESTREVYSKNPLDRVTCGLRFPPILSIVSKEPAEFQEKIRTYYPLYETGLVLSPLLQQGVPGIATPQISGALPMVHRFISADRVTEIDLARDFVSVSTRKYRRWEEFTERVSLAMSALETVYGPAFYVHVELRYQDVIDRQALGLGDTPWKDLIHGPVIGMLADHDVANLVATFQSQTLINLGNDEFLNLVQSLGGQVRGPVQVIGHQQTFPIQQGSPKYAIDADFYTAKRRSSEEVPADLTRFNREAGYFFRRAITPKLRNALQPVPL
jgi:uncharacterized protein (TIGR04255 family)